MLTGWCWSAAGTAAGGPSAIAGIDPKRGLLTWRHALPPGSQVFLFESSFEVLTAVCRPGACRLTAWDAWSGGLQWTRAVSGAVRVVDACRVDARTTADGRSGDGCGFYLVTPDRVGTVDPDDGGLHWQAGLRPPDGIVDRIIKDNDRVIMATAPAKSSCRATVLASGVTSGDGDRGWRYSFVWDQPQAPRDARTGCRWDRTLPLTVGFRMVLRTPKAPWPSIPTSAPCAHPGAWPRASTWSPTAPGTRSSARTAARTGSWTQAPTRSSAPTG
ncbi:hypothetical protein ABZ904_44165 [Streptomyces sp. NPDC046900]|uniref:hypothetical protein n=1 Tax=Streptomyces sp. NPDC046900 TaxID=3155473 RepID=UPI003403C1D1